MTLPIFSPVAFSIASSASGSFEHVIFETLRRQLLVGVDPGNDETVWPWSTAHLTKEFCGFRSRI